MLRDCRCMDPKCGYKHDLEVSPPQRIRSSAVCWVSVQADARPATQARARQDEGLKTQPQQEHHPPAQHPQQHSQPPAALQHQVGPAPAWGANLDELTLLFGAE